jgi:putative heme-binding domain-containing protein
MLVLALSAAGMDEEAARADPPPRPVGLPARTPWTSSRLVGSPDPPPPYRLERAFPKLTFTNPVLLTRAPVGNRLFIAEQAGKIYSFPNDQAADRADLFLDTTKLGSWDRDKVQGVEAVYGLAFHPKFAVNRYCYVCYVLRAPPGRPPLADGTRVARFRVTDTDPPRCDPASETIILTWLAGGHNGGDLHFGPDGFLYISTGDATDPNPPDGLDTGQDLSDLLACILRIDVDRTEDGRPYAIPPDNPFIKTPGARPEIWAYGFRNPWRMSFDRATGDLWVGDVGWEQWEMVYRVRRGGNYGWSVMEGRQPVRPESRRGPTPILPPAIDFPHSEAASITGGYVYRGRRLKDLVGAYLCGDWMTGRVWATRFDGERIVSHREIARGPLRIVAFGEDHDGELYLLHHHEQGTIHQLVPNAVKDHSADFPRTLSATGLFAAVRDHRPAPGVVPFSINAEQWADHATAERFVALPGTSTVRVYDTRVHVPGTPWFSATVFFPPDGVLVRTFSLELERGNPQSRRRIETQILHFDGTEWRGYSYRWNEEQTDATLVPAAGQEVTFTIVDPHAPGGRRKQIWRFPGRAECLQCHNPWAGQTLAFNLPQLDREHDYGGTTDQQLRTLQHVGILTPLRKEGEKDVPAPFRVPYRLVNPHDPAADLNARARSYLHVNCAHCHQPGAGGTAEINLLYDAPLEPKALEVRPVQGSFGIPGAFILAPGDPYRSVLYYRMAKLGPGRMPHIDSQVVDEAGLRLIHDWIRQLPGYKDERALVDKLIRARPADRRAALDRLLASTPSALLLLRALDEGRLPEPVRREVLAAAMAHSDSQIRDLFERFVPDEQRVKRLGSVIRPEQILALQGDAARGRDLFFKNAGLQCANCHRVNGAGHSLGPDLTQAGKKYTRAQLLDSILDPSKSIDPQYVAYLLETTDGQLHSGLLAEKTEREVVLKQAGGKEVRIPASTVQRLVPQPKSLMPELLLRDLTAEQAADLLEFLAGLR